MEKESQDELLRVYATLLSLRKNIEQMDLDIHEKYVKEYHDLLNRLDSIGEDISEFRIPDIELWEREGLSNYKTGGITLYKSKGVDKPYLMTKLDAILNYFEIITSEKPKKIGFRTSQDES